MTDQETRDLLLIAFEYSYLHNDWVFPLAEALEGITAEQAEWQPGPAMKGIWDIVLHLAAWNENIVERIETGEKTRPKEGAWPPLPASESDAEWEAAKTRLWASIAALRELIETVPLDKVRSSPYGFGDLVCRFNHMAYHTGQITKIRECRGW